MMTAKRALGLFLALIALVIAPTASMAQTKAGDSAAPAANTSATVSGTASNTASDATPDANAKQELPWLKFCGSLKDDKQGRKLCVVRQLVYAQNQLIARFIVRNNPADSSPLLVMASMPTGVTLPFGMRMQIDNGREMVLPYLECDTSMCNVRTVVDQAFVDSLKRGGVLKLTSKNARGKNFTVEIDLKGFTSVYDGDKYVSLDKQAKDQTATQKLGQAVQDLAEQLRRQKEAAAKDGTSTDTTTAPATGN